MFRRIRISALTFLFEGNVMHKDSLGTEVEIKPGQVNWMTAGKGIVHSERTPAYQRDTQKTLHGLQIWVALPKELEAMEPSFYHANAEDLPRWESDGIAYTLIAGSIMNKKSPVPVFSPLYFLKLKNTSRQTVNIGNDLYGEAGLYILEGSIESDGETYQPKELLIAKDNKLCSFTMNPNTTIYFFGGEPFAEERFIYWNFVASHYQTIENAKQQWREQKFARVPGETDFVPLPPDSVNLKPHK
jgi:redox-sensitive bicupin YhaK (pirin superfamily)